MPTFATPESITAAVTVAGARVRVTASDGTDTVVLVEPIDQGSPSDVKVAGKTKVDFAAGQLTVKTTVSGDKKGSVAITIDLPAGSGLAANLGYSSIQADGPLGACDLDLASSRAELDRIGSLRANIANGEVTVAHVAGQATITGGDVVTRIGHAAADVELTGGSGSLDIARADGSVTATTGDGAIRIRQLTRGHAELLNRSGNIEIGISEGTAAQIEAKSERGSVRNSLSSAADPGPSDDMVTVRARTRYGDVVVERAAS